MAGYPRSFFVLSSLAIMSLSGCDADVSLADSGDDFNKSDSDSDADTDADADADADADTDMGADAGDDIAGCQPIAFTEDMDWGDPLYQDEIGTNGDRDFYCIDVSEGVEYIFSTAADLGDEEGMPDTVLRMYNSDGEFVYENDDMPFRAWGMDSSFYYQPKQDETIYLEVLEWSDWADYEGGASGGSGWSYDLIGYPFFIEDPEPNNTMEEADAIDASEEVSGYYTNWFADNIGDIYGTIGEAGDVDLWRLEYDWGEEGSTAVFYTWSLWPIYAPGFEPEFTVYNEAGDVVAHTLDPIFKTGGTWFDDLGILFRMELGEVYYLEVKDAAGGEGFGTFYPIVHTGYSEESAPVEAEPNDFPGSGTATMSESDSTPDYFSTDAWGEIEADGNDCYKIDGDEVSGGLAGKYITVTIQAQDLGSLLDANITIYDEDGSELASATEDLERGSADPAIRDLALDDERFVTVCVGAEDRGDVDESNYYVMATRTYIEPLYE